MESVLMRGTGSSRAEVSQDWMKVPPAERENAFHMWRMGSMREGLKKGEIPAAFQEDLRIAPFESPEGQRFNAAMHAFMQSAFAKPMGQEWHDLKRFDRELDHARFLLADTTQSNAAFVLHAHPPLFIIHRGCFEAQSGAVGGGSVEPLIQRDEDLALLLYHELVHHRIRQLYGEVKNSKIEESTAYAIPLEMLHDQGRDPRHGFAFYKRLMPLYPAAGKRGAARRPDAADEMLEEHPTPETAYAVVEGMMAQLKWERGTMDNGHGEPSWGWEAVASAAKQARHTSFLAEQMHALGFQASLATDEKARKLGTILHSLPTEPSKIRWRDLAEEIRRLGPVDLSDSSAEVLLSLADACLRMMESGLLQCGSALYTSCCTALKPESDAAGLQPLGRLRPLAEALESFLGSVRGWESEADDAEIIRTARIFCDAAAKEPLTAFKSGREFLRTISLPQFFLVEGADEREESRQERKLDKMSQSEKRMKENSRPAVPWQILYALAEEQETVLRAALLLGLDDDPNVLQAIEKHDHLGLQYFGLRPGEDDPTIGSFARPVRSRSADYLLRDAEIDEEGRIASMKAQAAMENDRLLRRRLLFHLFDVIHTGRYGEPETFVPQLRNQLGRTVTPDEDEFASKFLVPEERFESDPILWTNINAVQIESYRNRHTYAEMLARLLQTDPKSLESILEQGWYLRPPGRLNPDGIYKSSAFVFALINDASVRDEFVDAKTIHPSDLFSAMLWRDPLTHFTLTHQPNLLTEEERAFVLLNPCFRDLSYFLGKLFKHADVLQEFRIQLIKRLQDILPSLHERSAPAESWSQLCGEGKILASYFGAGESMSALEAVRCEIRKIDASILMQKSVLMQIPDLRSLCRETELITGDEGGFSILLKRYSQLQAERLMPEILQLAVEERAAVWLEARRADMLLPQVKVLLLRSIIQELPQTPSAQRESAILSILAAEHINDPVLRAMLFSTLAETLRERYGQDDGSETHAGVLERAFDRCCTNLPRIDWRDFFQVALIEVEAQSACCRWVHRKVDLPLASDFEKAEGSGRIGEGVLRAAQRSLKEKRMLMDYLMQPYSDPAREAFIDNAASIVASFDPDALETDFHTEDASSKKKPKSFKERIGTVKNKYRAEQVRLAVQQMHDNFWALSLEGRAAVIRELFRDSDDMNVPVSEDVLSDAIRRTVPAKDANASVAERWIRSYVRSLEPFQQPLAVAALMVAARRQGEEDLALGEALAIFLETVGPAETKAGQCASSHPSVPEELRKDLSRLKFHADEPYRWIMMQWIDRHCEEITDGYDAYVRAHGLPRADDPDERGRVCIRHVEKVAGSGSMFVAVRLRMSDGRRQVLALRRPFVESRADTGFGTMTSMAKELPKGDKSRSTLEEIIAQAKRKIGVEADPRVAREQYDAAKRLYEDLTVTVDGQAMVFHVPQVTASGEEFFLMEELTGQHFLELSSRQEDAGRRRALAMGILTVELSHILHSRFDNDRHGGNVLIDAPIPGRPERIGNLDFKALSLGEWSQEGHDQFAGILLRILHRCSNANEFIDAFLQEQETLRTAGRTINPFVSEVQKALLSLGEYASLLQPGDLLRVLLSALRGGLSENMIRAIITQCQDDAVFLSLLRFFMPSVPASMTDQFARDLPRFRSAILKEVEVFLRTGDLPVGFTFPLADSSLIQMKNTVSAR
ncbi:hypothetical protein HY213_02655 [Candidatus Peregrinibacteria bacterium]|nr:hypothetical protein [Candidatus Peregrinibacteria bacterium]